MLKVILDGVEVVVPDSMFVYCSGYDAKGQPIYSMAVSRTTYTPQKRCPKCGQYEYQLCYRWCDDQLFPRDWSGLKGSQSD